MIYFDNAATTKVYDECYDIIREYSEKYYFNPSQLYKPSLTVSQSINGARAKIASIINCSPEEIYFTSGATESNNIVINGAYKNKKVFLVTSAGEHPSVYNAVTAQYNKGAKTYILPLKSDGTADISLLPQNISLISVLHVSNETGAINDIKEISKRVRADNKNALIHSDGVQAAGKLDIDVKALGVDMYTISGHKIHAPKGIGALYIKKGTNINPLFFGGGQEKLMRSGTENVAGIICLAYALERKSRERDIDKVKKLKETFKKALSILTGIYFNSDDSCSPYILSLTAENVRGEVLLHSLEKYGILIATGSACSSRYSDNRILSAMGINEKMIKCSVRLSFDEYTSEADVNDACSQIINQINDIRRVSE